MASPKPQPPGPLVARVRALCTALPDVVEVEAWTGTSWRVRKQTFAHIAQITDGWPPAYARAAGQAGPLTVLTFQAEDQERAALVGQGPPFFGPPWRPGIVGVALDAATAWDEIGELVTESWCLLAPRVLVAAFRSRRGAEP